MNEFKPVSNSTTPIIGDKIRRGTILLLITVLLILKAHASLFTRFRFNPIPI
jgi:hypothetical protein